MIRSHSALPCAAALLATIILTLSACSSDEPKKQDPSPAAAMDAGAPMTPDAGPPPAPDAGPPSTPDAAMAPDAGTLAVASTPSDDAPRGKSSVFDRVLAKPEDVGASLDELRGKIEKATGAKVQSIKKSMRTWVLIEFAPASPARGDAEQRRILDKIEGTGLFSKVEGDRMMKVK
jgi:hypothetical protein